MNLHNAKIISNKVNDTYGILCYLMSRYHLELSTSELETLSKYLSYYNYTTYGENTFYDNNGNIRFLQSIKNTNGEVAHLIYNYSSSELTLVEGNSTTNFTEGERIDFIFTKTGKMILQTFNGFNQMLFYNEKSSRKIRINKYREVFIPKNLEPDDLFDFSDNDSDFYKLISIKSKINLIKLNIQLENEKVI